MTITKRTVIDQTTVDEATGITSFRLKKLIEEDGELLTEPQYHRVTIEPGQDVDAVLADVNTHLTSAQLKAGPIDAPSISVIKTRCEQEHTPERILGTMDRKIKLIEDLLDAIPVDQRDPTTLQTLDDMKIHRDAFVADAGIVVDADVPPGTLGGRV